MATPMFRVVSDGLDPKDVAGALEGAGIDYTHESSWHVYHLGADTISVAENIVAINQHA